MGGINFKPSNLSESLLPILVLNWIFGHQIMSYAMDGYKFIQTFFYFIIVFIVYGTFISYAVFLVVSADWFKSSEVVFIVVVSTNILKFVINFTLGWKFRSKTLLINTRSLNVDKMLTQIGATLDRKREFNYAIYVAIYWLISSLTVNLVALLWSLKVLSLRDNVFIIFSMYQPLHVNFLVDLLFCLLIRNMEIRFKQINNELLNFESLQYSRPVTNIRVNESRQVYILRLLKGIHLELVELCHEITHIFGFQLITSMASLFVLITAMSYNLWVTAVSMKAVDKMLRIFIFIFWIVIHISKLMFINHTCSKTVNEWHKTGVIIHQLETKTVNTQICKLIQQLSIQTIQNPLVIFPLGFLQLGHSFMQGFFGTIATYLIILIQMAPPENVEF